MRLTCQPYRIAFVSDRKTVSRPVGFPFLAVGILLFSSLACDRTEAIPTEGTLVLTDGARKPVRLVKILSDGVLVTTHEKTNREWQTSEFIRFGSPQNDFALDILILKNGSLLAGVVISVNPERVELQSRTFDLTTIPVQALKGIIFRQKLNRVSHQKVLDRILSERHVQTIAGLSNEDVVKGNLAGNRDKDAVAISILDFRRIIQHDQLDYLIFPSNAAAADGKKSSHAVLGLVDGSQLKFEEIRIDEEFIRLQLDQNLTLKAPRQIRQKSFFERVCYYQPANSNIRFLSSAAALKIVKQGSNVFQNVGRNRASNGGPLRFQSETYDWGLGTHGNSQIIYPILPEDRIFRVTVALDDSSHPLGNVNCRVLLLGVDNQWKTVTAALNVKRADSQRLEVDVKGAKAIGLVTSTGRHSNVGDRLNWLDARIHK